jgi:prolipoprotein diacylglyceryltransferase
LFPFFEIFPGFFVYSFGITLTICFFAFVWNLQRLAKRFWYSFSFFTQNILWFFLSIFFFSRVFYIVWKWQDMKFIQDPLQFFLMNEYSFSIFGAIFWFLVVLWILTRLERSSITRYIDGVVLSFLFVLVLGYIGSLFGGQVYGKPTDLGIEISYTNSYTQVEYQVPIFPLPIIYAFISFLIFSWLSILSLFLHMKGFIGYMGLILFSIMILIFESFSWKQDIISVSSIFNLPQIFSFILLAWSSYGFYTIFKDKAVTAPDSI